MPTAATMGGQAAASSNSANAGANQAQAAQAGIAPFIRATGFHRELILDTTVPLTTADQQQPVVNINAYGFLAAIRLLVTGTAGSGWTGATVTEDGPWSVIKNLVLTTPSGNVNLINLDSGYGAYLIHKYGGYGGLEDPKADLNTYVYTTGSATAPNLGFELRFPLQLDVRTALAALPNKAANAPFKFFWTVAASTNVFTGTVGVQPSIRFRWILEAWDPPQQTTGAVTNQLTPPVLNTAQYWTYNTYQVPAGAFSPLFNGRMGNSIRTVISVLRRASSTRANGDADWPDPVQILVDQRNADYVYKLDWQHDIYNLWGYGAAAEAAGGRDNGVYPYGFYARDFDGRFGRELRNQYLQTIEGTRYQYQGVWGNAGTITQYINDVVPTGSIFS